MDGFASSGSEKGPVYSEEDEMPLTVLLTS